MYSPAAAALIVKGEDELNAWRKSVKLLVLRGVCHGSITSEDASDSLDQIDVMSMQALGEFAEKLAK